MDASAFRHLGDGIKYMFRLAFVALPISLILNVVLAVLLWWKW